MRVGFLRVGFCESFSLRVGFCESLLLRAGFRESVFASRVFASRVFCESGLLRVGSLASRVSCESFLLRVVCFASRLSTSRRRLSKFERRTIRGEDNLADGLAKHVRQELAQQYARATHTRLGLDRAEICLKLIG